jgi:pyrroline-5-carboxylate reductase
MQIGFIGAGNMASALAAAITKADSTAVIVAHDPDHKRLERFSQGLSHFLPAADNREVTVGSDVTFLAVKPQVVPQACEEISDCSVLLVSIAAGVPIATLESLCPSARVVRVMPNTPCLVGEMAAGFALGNTATAEDCAIVERLLNSAGVAIQLEEELLDAVTGLSGSGPAFVARLVDAFIKAGVAVGLPENEARRLILGTFSGTAHLLTEHSLSGDQLVEMVSSPGGTTVAGRRVLEESDYEDIILRTVRAATERSRELGK